MIQAEGNIQGRDVAEQWIWSYSKKAPKSWPFRASLALVKILHILETWLRLAFECLSKRMYTVRDRESIRTSDKQTQNKVKDWSQEENVRLSKKSRQNHVILRKPNKDPWKASLVRHRYSEFISHSRSAVDFMSLSLYHSNYISEDRNRIITTWQHSPLIFSRVLEF